MKNTTKFFAVVLALVCMLALFVACDSNVPDDDVTPETKEFVYATDLVDGITVDKALYTFTLSATYGKELCQIKVFMGGKEIAPQNGNYSVELSEGANTVSVEATADGENDQRSYTINYVVPVFVIECDAANAEIQVDGTIEFSVNATYGSNACTVQVSCGGVLVSVKENGKYTVQLDEGLNTITVVVTSQGKSEKRTFDVTFRKDFAFVCDLEQASITNDIVSFSASATFNDVTCATIVKHNGEVITANSDGKYTVTLAVGKNVFSVTARKGDFVEEKTYEINYQGFSLTTTLNDNITTMNSSLRFNLSVRYGESVADFEVTAEGATLARPSQFMFILVLPKAGKYDIKITATNGNASFDKTLSVTYVTDPPHLESISLVSGKTYKGELCCFDVEAQDALGNKVDDSALSFYVDVGQTGNYTKLTSADITKVWSDSVKTSYRFSFTNGAFADCINKKLNFKVQVTSALGSSEQVFEMTYVGADPDGKIGQVVLSVEGFTIGCKYFLEPTLVDIYAGENMAQALTRVLTEKGWAYTNTGTIEKGFYLASIVGMDLSGNAIDEGLLAILRKTGATVFKESITAGDDGKYSLGEFDFTQGSGWMYSVNGTYPNYGFADHYPQDGEVVRVQFTLAYGSDLGGGSALGGGGANYNVAFGDFAAIHTALATVKANNYYGKDNQVYNQVLQAVAHWDADNKLLDEQLAILKSEYGI